MDVEDEIQTLKAALLAHKALIVALMGVMQAKGMIDQADINDVTDSALTGAENMVGVDPDLAYRARVLLEDTSRNMGGRRKKLPLWP